MDRRFFIFGAVGAAVSSSLHAESRPLGPMTQVYVQTPNRIMQKCPEWCWAASTAMIFAMNGHPVDQETIIERVFNGATVCTTGSSSVMTSLLSSQWTDKNGVNFQSNVVAAYDVLNGIIAIDNNVILDELANNRPLLYANKHHAMAVVSATYLPTPYGPNVQNVGVLDPWPWAADYHPLSYTEMVPAHKGGDYSYLAAVHIT